MRITDLESDSDPDPECEVSDTYSSGNKISASNQVQLSNARVESLTVQEFQDSLESDINSTGIHHVDLGALCSQYEHGPKKTNAAKAKTRDTTNYHMRKLKKQMLN